jgi:hypothetical protein
MLSFRCPNCSGSVPFAGANSTVACPSCGRRLSQRLGTPIAFGVLAVWLPLVPLLGYALLEAFGRSAVGYGAVLLATVLLLVPSLWFGLYLLGGKEAGSP